MKNTNTIIVNKLDEVLDLFIKQLQEGLNTQGKVNNLVNGTHTAKLTDVWDTTTMDMYQNILSVKETLEQTLTKL
jgi:hypothetical protein